ncbi:hypothetical protein BDF19DRAFT_233630 [Syncephalis fuscata]|nr:hypothetical protein BDF19DRAFT_233630 [Syncephalis fuscata]
MDNALRKMSLPWLSFTSSSSSSTNNQHSHSQHNNSAMAVATAGNGQMTASNGGGGNGNGAASNDGADAPTTLREKERRSRSPNRLSTLFRDLRRRGTGSSSKERSPERHRWQQWSSDPTLTQRAREMAQGAPPMPSLNGGPLKPSGVPSIHVRHSSKDYSSSGQNVHNIAKDPRSRSIGDLRGVAEEHRRAQAASDYPMPMVPKGIKGVGAATGLTRSESERSTKRSSTKITSGATGNGIASPLVAGHGESMNMTTPSIDDANGATSSLTSGRGEAMNMTAPSIDGVNGTEHSIESPTVVSTGLPESITSPIAIATVPLPSWKLAGSPTRSLQHPFSTTTMVTRRNLLNVVRSVSASEEAANDIQEADEEGGGGLVDGGNGGDLDATSSATRSTMRPKAAPALAMMIEEEEEEE